MAEDETRRAERKAKRNSQGSMSSDETLLTELSVPETPTPDISDQSVNADMQGDDEDEDEDSRPDFLLRETARIVVDIAELESNHELLERRFSQLNAEDAENQKIN